ncbi:MAG: hypothetical protein HY451_01050 [Parcubacteria group bacterium]|nr:hypothetical protein [Parcubacteria group bacterium]
MTRAVLDLKNPKNRKINNSHSVNDILGGLPSEALAKEGGPPAELETEPAPKEEDFFNPVDRRNEIPDNPGIMNEAMAFPATLTHAESLAWTAPDKHHELISHALRKWVIVVLTAMAFVALFWQGSILTGITFFALALVTSMHFWREAAHHQYEIHPHGVAVGGEFYHYHDLDSFWIHHRPDGFHELSLCTGRLLNHYIKISLKDQDPFEIRGALMPHLSEKRHEEGLEDWLRRKLGL